MAYTYIQGPDKNRSGKLEEDLVNHYVLGQDMYPTDLASATSMVMNYMNKINNPNHPSKKGQEQKNAEVQKVGFAQSKQQKDWSKVKCYNCGEKGHIAPNCPKKKETANVQHSSASDHQDDQEEKYTENEVNHSQVGEWSNYQQVKNSSAKIVMTQKQTQEAMKDWLLLDSQSTTDIFGNKSKLQNIKSTGTRLF